MTLSDEQKQHYIQREWYLHGEAEKFCIGVGLPKDLLRMIATSDSDWAFTLKVDALMESAVKHLLRHGLCFRFGSTTFKDNILEEFVDKLPMNGRTSLVKLLDACGMPAHERNYLESLRDVRNAYAHNIEYVGLRLHELIKLRRNRTKLLKDLCLIEVFVEADVLQSFEEDPTFFRFLILVTAKWVLMYSYQLAVKEKIAQTG